MLQTGFSWHGLSRCLVLTGLAGALTLGLTACGPRTADKTEKKAEKKAAPKQSLPGSGGKTCEIIVVCPKAYYENLFRDSLQHWFMEPQPLLNQAEPRFTLANIQPEAFKDNPMFMHHRNILGI